MKKRLCFMFVLLSVLLFSGHAYSWTPTQEDQKKLDSNYGCKQTLKTDIESIASNGENAKLKQISSNDISKIKKLYKDRFDEDLATYLTSGGETHEPGYIDDFIKDVLSGIYCTEVDQGVIENANIETNDQAPSAPAEQPAPAEKTASEGSSTNSDTSDRPYAELAEEPDVGESGKSAEEEAENGTSSAPEAAPEEAPEEAPTDAKSEPQENAALPTLEDEGKTAEAGTTPETKDTLIERLRKDAEQIVAAYTETKKHIEDTLKASNQ